MSIIISINLSTKNGVVLGIQLGGVFPYPAIGGPELNSLPFSRRREGRWEKEENGCKVDEEALRYLSSIPGTTCPRASTHTCAFLHTLNKYK